MSKYASVFVTVSKLHASKIIKLNRLKPGKLEITFNFSTNKIVIFYPVSHVYNGLI